jgi:hypothetical protein
VDRGGRRRSWAAWAAPACHAFFLEVIMPAVVLYPNVGAMNNIGLIRTNLVNCEVKLYQNDLVPTPSTVLGDLTVATFSGYAAIVVSALLAAYLDPAGGASAQIATVQFNHDGGGVANSIYGFWVQTTGGVLVLAGRFEDLVPMQLLGDSIPIDVKFNFGN